MAGAVEKKLAELGINLPTPASPVANYIPFVRVGSLLFVSGQICLDANGKLVAKGKLGGGVSVEDGQKAARACAINVLAQVKAALGDLDKVKQVVRLGGFHQFRPRLSRRSQGHERGLRPDGCGARRQGPACPYDGWRRRFAGRRGGRGRRDFRGRLSHDLALDWSIAQLVAHRGLQMPKTASRPSPSVMTFGEL